MRKYFIVIIIIFIALSAGTAVFLIRQKENRVVVADIGLLDIKAAQKYADHMSEVSVSNIEKSLLDLYIETFCLAHGPYVKAGKNADGKVSDINEAVRMQMELEKNAFDDLENKLGAKMQEENGKGELAFQKYFLTKQHICDDVRKAVLAQVVAMLDYECSEFSDRTEIDKWRIAAKNSDLNPFFVRGNFFDLIEEGKQSTCPSKVTKFKN